jgi:hypothetical protein
MFLVILLSLKTTMLARSIRNKSFSPKRLIAAVDTKKKSRKGSSSGGGGGGGRKGKRKISAIKTKHYA